LHFGNVNYRHMPLTRLKLGMRSWVLSAVANQPTVPAEGNPACVHRGRVSWFMSNLIIIGPLMMGRFRHGRPYRALQ